VSVRPVGQRELGTRTEVKNINSFKFVEKALEYEIKRQIRLLEEGEKVIQETRLWDSSKGITESMRGKEEAHDYRYFPEPDLVPMTPTDEWVNEIRASLPELPDKKRGRFISEYGLPEYDADMLVAERSTAEWFEEAVKMGGKPKNISNLILTEVFKYLKDQGKDINETNLKPIHLVSLSGLVETAVVSATMAKSQVLYEIFNTGKMPEEIIKEKGLVQISDSGAIEKAIDEVIAKNPKEAERFRAGDEKLISFFVGQVMKSTKGKANPQMVNEILKKKLDG
ncbi:MAG TPA: Asp-tRNA(Asn)/Glu-tRNA(Gln) amidotransferase GatCAB subunit B, partial [Thermodesulfovibrionales bacterium]|nr:Asp-tRNA(Asn)/Glu-tRNA(Gln) amidotransferase GatCAB subunit B [Thermodesulfovibrionales bacterium]